MAEQPAQQRAISPQEGEIQEQALPPARAEQHDQDVLHRLDTWLERLEEQARQLLATFAPDDLTPAQAASAAYRHLILIARLLELRQQFTAVNSNMEERLLRIIFGQPESEA